MWLYSSLRINFFRRLPRICCRGNQLLDRGETIKISLIFMFNRIDVCPGNNRRGLDI